MRPPTSGRSMTPVSYTHLHDLRSLLRGGANDAEIASAIAPIWQQRNDRYSELRSSLPADTGQGARRVEMSYIGG